MLSRLSLCCLPTPCHPLERVSQDLGIDLWMKRDDLTGFGGGGNKGRKLEFIMADAIDQGVDRIVSCGSRQSNFVRQLGAACSVLGISCTAAVMDLPYDDESGKPAGDVLVTGGNEVLDDIFGVELRSYPDDDWMVLFRHSSEIAQEYRDKGEKVLEVPIGGSMPMGAYAFTLAALEVGEGWDTIVTPTSSGSTHAGLAWAYHKSRTQVIGVACDPEEDLVDDLCRLTAGIDEITGSMKGMSRDDFVVRKEWVGAGYNVGSPEGEAAIRYLAGREGVLLDPVYSGKAFAGLLAMAQRGEVSGRVLYWHTGGLPTLFAAPRQRQV